MVERTFFLIQNLLLFQITFLFLKLESQIFQFRKSSNFKYFKFEIASKLECSFLFSFNIYLFRFILFLKLRSKTFLQLTLICFSSTDLIRNVISTNLSQKKNRRSCSLRAKIGIKLILLSSNRGCLTKTVRSRSVSYF